jgi:hypothetical protein
MEHSTFDSTTRFLSECDDFDSFLDTASPAELEAYADGSSPPNLKEIEREAERALVEEEEDFKLAELLENLEYEQRKRAEREFSDYEKHKLRLETIRIASSTTVPDLMID